WLRQGRGDGFHAGSGETCVTPGKDKPQSRQSWFCNGPLLNEPTTNLGGVLHPRQIRGAIRHEDLLRALNGNRRRPFATGIWSARNRGTRNPSLLRCNTIPRKIVSCHVNFGRYVPTWVGASRATATACRSPTERPRTSCSGSTAGRRPVRHPPRTR